jgi:hypothetical protein
MAVPMNYREMHLHRFILCICFIGILMLMSNLGAAFGQTDAKTYRCTLKDIASLKDDGTLKDSDNYYRKRFDRTIIDTLTGAITFADGNREIWRVIQKGSGANDHVLVPRASDFYEPTVEEAFETAATDFIRVRAWSSDPQVKFIAFGLSTLVSGTCEVVR